VGCWQVAVPRQEIINPVGGMIGDMRQHVAQSGFGVETVQLGRANQRPHKACSAAELSISMCRRSAACQGLA